MTAGIVTNARTFRDARFLVAENSLRFVGIALDWMTTFKRLEWRRIYRTIACGNFRKPLRSSSKD
jgi:hypothetical protein